MTLGAGTGDQSFFVIIAGALTSVVILPITIWETTSTHKTR
jgi:hypothetical protein